MEEGMILPECSAKIEFESRLHRCELVVPTTADISRKIRQAKEMLEHRKFEISPLTNNLFGQLENAAEKFVNQGIARVQPLVKEQLEIKRQVKARYTELDLIEMYKPSGIEGAGSFGLYMMKRPRDSDDSIALTELGLPSTEEDENAVCQKKRIVCLLHLMATGSLSLPAESTIRSFWVDETFALKYTQRLELVEMHTNLKLREVAEFQWKLERHDTELERFNDELAGLLRNEYEHLLRQRKQYDNLLGIIEFVEEEMFPQYPGYRATFEELVHGHCKEKMITAKDMSAKEVRRCKWLSAASLDMGKMGVLPRLGEQPFQCLADWTPEFLADFVVRLTSAVAECSWEGCDGEPTVGDQIMAVDAAWLPDEYHLDGWVTPAMHAICGLIPIYLPGDYNFL